MFRATTRAMRVNPARAGMIPLDSMFAAVKAGKPRASGDDPFACYPYSAIELVNPARAGMIRH